MAALQVLLCILLSLQTGGRVRAGDLTYDFPVWWRMVAPNRPAVAQLVPGDMQSAVSLDLLSERMVKPPRWLGPAEFDKIARADGDVQRDEIPMGGKTRAYSYRHVYTEGKDVSTSIEVVLQVDEFTVARGLLMFTTDATAPRQPEIARLVEEAKGIMRSARLIDPVAYASSVSLVGSQRVKVDRISIDIPSGWKTEQDASAFFIRDPHDEVVLACFPLRKLSANDTFDEKFCARFADPKAIAKPLAKQQAYAFEWISKKDGLMMTSVIIKLSEQEFARFGVARPLSIAGGRVRAAKAIRAALSTRLNG